MDQENPGMDRHTLQNFLLRLVGIKNITPNIYIYIYITLFFESQNNDVSLFTCKYFTSSKRP